jgi:hypothetical protein
MDTEQNLTSVPLPAELFKQKSARDILGTAEPFLSREAYLSSEATKAKGEELKARQSQAEVEAKGTQEAAEKAAAQQRGAMQEYKTSLEREPLPAFVPTKETAGDLATLFTLTNIIGFVIGGRGKQNAQAAMSAMNGMLEGHQKGREDIYKKEKEEFDRNFKEMVQRHAELRQEMEDAIKLSAVDKEAGMQAAHLAAVKSGSDIIKAQVNQGRFIDALNTVKDVQKTVDRAQDVVLKENLEEKKRLAELAKVRMEITAKASEGVANRENLREIERMKETAQMERLTEQIDAKTRAELLKQFYQKQRDERLFEQKEKLLKAKEETGAGLKPPAKVVEGYLGDLQLKTDLSSIREDLNNPKLKEQIKQYRTEAFLTEEGKVLNQLISSDIPPELKAFLNKIRTVRNNYYLNISGKAVTGGEALRNYGVVPQPGDTAEDIAIKVDGMINNVEGSIEQKQTIFKLPKDVKRQPLQPTNLKPGEDYNISGTPSQTSGGATVSNW